ncbi:hypothetical protein PAALTS15_09945 [Paenibacillus alvei TS-15]|uniref:Uncharacterized protein n=1 Tax=Paenibacillus alvei TS-15 TaxID=1117108 RepID=S9STH3_PAEAL|nr:hypothetical protein [Paenibacillus alvei]EPY07438.1 hypothetical protein PAALTS15_09945 [Paenibacillus alvei TS-15]
MDEIQRRKAFQKIKTMTHEQFWTWMNGIHSQAYFMGQEHIVEAMRQHPRIYRPMVAKVLESAKDIRESQGMKEINVEDTMERFVIKEAVKDDTESTDD